MLSHISLRKYDACESSVLVEFCSNASDKELAPTGSGARIEEIFEKFRSIGAEPD